MINTTFGFKADTQRVSVSREFQSLGTLRVSPLINCIFTVSEFHIWTQLMFRNLATPQCSHFPMFIISHFCNFKIIDNFYTFQILISFCMLCYNSWEEISISFYLANCFKNRIKQIFCRHHHFSVRNQSGFFQLISLFATFRTGNTSLPTPCFKCTIYTDKASPSTTSNGVLIKGNGMNLNGA